MSSELVALLGGNVAGRVHRDKAGRLTFVYDRNWREAVDAYPLSLSMPLAAETVPNLFRPALDWRRWSGSFRRA
jgi:HipA-like protein